MDNSLMAVVMLAVNAIMYSLYYFYIFMQNRNRYLTLWGFGWITYGLGYLLVLLAREEIFSTIFKYSFSLLSSMLILMGTYSFVEKKIPPILLNLAFALICIVIAISIATPGDPFFIKILSLSTSIILMMISVASGLTFLVTNNDTRDLLSEMTGWMFIIWGIHKGFYPFVSPDFVFSESNHLTSIVLINAVNMTIILCFLDQNNKVILNQEVRLRKLAEASEQRHSALEISRQKLLSNISHELRTPITSIIGNLSIITDGIEKDYVKIKDYANKSLQKSITLNVLIQDLFELSTQEAMQMKFQRKTVQVDELLKILRKKVNIDEETTGIALKFSQLCKKSQRKCPYIFVDTLRFEQVIQNMVTNAEKNIEHNGKIHVFCQCSNYSSAVSPECVQIRVKDTGSGISDDDLPHIFEMFFKTPNVSEKTGTGLGLALSKDIINYHSGSIDVETKLGHGTTFIISLPVEKKGDDTYEYQ